MFLQNICSLEPHDVIPQNTAFFDATSMILLFKMAKSFHALDCAATAVGCSYIHETNFEFAVAASLQTKLDPEGTRCEHTSTCCVLVSAVGTAPRNSLQLDAVSG